MIQVRNLLGGSGSESIRFIDEPTIGTDFHDVFTAVANQFDFPPDSFRLFIGDEVHLDNVVTEELCEIMQHSGISMLAKPVILVFHTTTPKKETRIQGGYTSEEMYNNVAEQLHKPSDAFQLSVHGEVIENGKQRVFGPDKVDVVYKGAVEKGGRYGRRYWY